MVVNFFLGGIGVLAMLWMGSLFILAGVGGTFRIWEHEWSQPSVTRIGSTLNTVWEVINRPAAPASGLRPLDAAQQPVRNVAAPAPAPAAPARTLLRPDFPEKRADGSIWMVRQWSDGSYQDLYQIQPPTAPAAPAPQAPAVPAPAAPAPAAPSGCPEAKIEASQPTQISAGCTVLGDVQVGESAGNVRKLYDDDPNTGLVVTFNRSGWVMAPWGASMTSNSASQVASQMRMSGCGSTCQSVQEKTW